MQQHDIHHYLIRFFDATKCEIIDNVHSIDVQLNIEMDKKLMNRPFYWHYLEKVGGPPNPMRIHFITSPNDAPEELKGELIHYGSPRLHQIFSSVSDMGGYIRLFEDVHPTSGNTPLHPWLLLNMKVSYQCDRKKDVIHSFGLHLLSGNMIENFYPKLVALALTPKIPDYCFTLSPIIKPESGVKRMQDKLQNILQQEDSQWADDAIIRWQHDDQLLEKFYEGIDELPESYHIEKNALKEQYEPHIHVSTINGGLFYLTQATSQTIN